VYKCKGTDFKGLWEGDRRYNEFFLLYVKLEGRWPGVPLPMLPPKKSMGNKDIKFINERRFYLERFLKKISTYDFILNS
jgi:sorting nexin-29